MKLAIIGSRNFHDYEKLKAEASKIEASVIISGGAKGADSLASKYAKDNNLELVEYLPDYARFQRAAPIMRNADIVKNSDVVLAFWDGVSRGTQNAINTAKKLKKQVVIISF